MEIDRGLDRDEIIHFTQPHRGFRTIDIIRLSEWADPVDFFIAPGFIYLSRAKSGPV